MTTSLAISVVPGILVGILFIAGFSYAYRPYIARSDAEIWEYVNSLPEAQAFRERYPDAEGKIWREYYYSGIRYPIDSRHPHNFHVTLAKSNDIRTLAITFEIGYSGLEYKSMGCGQLSARVGNVTVYDIRRNECLE